MVLLLIIFALLLIGDWYSTNKALSSNAGSEANPFMATLFKWLGVNVSLAITHIIAFAAGYFVAYYVPIYGIYMLGVLIALYSWVVYHNFKVINS